MRPAIVNPADLPYWDDLVLATKDYSFFHCADWAQVLCATYNYKPAYFMLHDRGKLPALIPVMDVDSLLTGRRGVSLCFTDYCEPLVEDQETFDFLLGRIIEHGRKSGWEHLEFRGGRQFLSNAPAYAAYMGHSLALSANEHDLLSSFRDSTRRNIRKAREKGVSTKICKDFASVKEFYRLHCMTRKRHGLPPQPFHFFRNVYDCVIARNRGFVVLAAHGGRNVSGAVYFHFGTKALYKYGASDETHQHLRANNLVMWEAIRWYATNGFSTFCFGRTDHDNKGLQQFKNGWGTTGKEIFYYRFDLRKEKFVSDDTGHQVQHLRYFRSLPNPVLKTIGQLLYRHMG